MHPKLIFRGAIKKALMVSEDRSYQKQYFAKISPSLLALTLHIHFYLHFQESAYDALWIVIVLKSAPKSAPETADGVDQFYKCFFFLHPGSFVIGENFPAMHGWRKFVFESPPFFFSLKHFRLFVFVKNYYQNHFFSNIFIKS